MTVNRKQRYSNASDWHLNAWNGSLIDSHGGEVLARRVSLWWADDSEDRQPDVKKIQSYNEAVALKGESIQSPWKMFEGSSTIGGFQRSFFTVTAVNGASMMGHCMMYESQGVRYALAYLRGVIMSLSSFPTPAIGNTKTSQPAEDMPSADTWIRTETQWIRIGGRHTSYVKWTLLQNLRSWDQQHHEYMIYSILGAEVIAGRPRRAQGSSSRNATHSTARLMENYTLFEVGGTKLQLTNSWDFDAQRQNRGVPTKVKETPRRRLPPFGYHPVPACCQTLTDNRRFSRETGQREDRKNVIVLLRLEPHLPWRRTLMSTHSDPFGGGKKLRSAQIRNKGLIKGGLGLRVLGQTESHTCQ
ncbi:hypothetical protein EI94DRAFT_1789415 [Lactarius quietus]|nr:hypothetical protein EI94DRAFT_1789415 [Lactarius quietus]